KTGLPEAVSYSPLTTRVATTSDRPEVPSQPLDPSSGCAATRTTTTASAAPMRPVSALEIRSRLAEGGGSAGFWKIALYCLPDCVFLSVRGLEIGFESGFTGPLGGRPKAAALWNGSTERSGTIPPFLS